MKGMESDLKLEVASQFQDQASAKVKLDSIKERIKNFGRCC